MSRHLWQKIEHSEKHLPENVPQMDNSFIFITKDLKYRMICFIA